jgi:hypothetical protein
LALRRQVEIIGELQQGWNKERGWKVDRSGDQWWLLTSPKRLRSALNVAALHTLHTIRVFLQVTAQSARRQAAGYTGVLPEEAVSYIKYQNYNPQISILQ